MKPEAMPRPSSKESLRALPYEDTKAAKPPISITVATQPRSQTHKGIIGYRKPKSSPGQQLLPHDARSKLPDDIRRDSGLAPSSSTARDSRTTLGTDVESSSSLRNSPKLPELPFQEKSVSQPAKRSKGWSSLQQEDLNIPPVPQVPFVGIATEIPTGSFDDLILPGKLEFSNRGSMLIGGKKANDVNGSLKHRTVGSRRPSVRLLSPTLEIPKRLLSADEEMLSSKVRFMYEAGGVDMEPDAARETPAETGQHKVEGDHPTDPPRTPSSSSIEMHTGPIGRPDASRGSRAHSRSEKKLSLLPKEETEMAGGFEDWENINSGDVDRYGFIVPRQTTEGSSLNSSRPLSPQPPRIQRVSTLLQLASEAPRRTRSKLGQSPSSGKSPARSATTMSNGRPNSRNYRPASSQSSYRGSLSGGHSKIRSATNKMLHNRDRRVRAEAGDMLTLPPSLSKIAESEESSKATHEMKRQEREREEKWRKMAKLVNQCDKTGGGMIFEFDTTSPKLIERTWKGIPDRWRATAWHAFLAASARKRNDLPTDEDLRACFHRLLEQGSPDDVQIDIDVPRTINSHIMFRRRYRGGQRLLFRVLHCLSIYFPDTGYVQGMAALAATLLCYFDEEMTFLMLVRLWQLRGLEKLYRSGFDGLMDALGEFEKGWLADGEVSAKLVSIHNPCSFTVSDAYTAIQNELEITPTAYGTRWYLTLFNYSIPFPAQLRVWDVFMLLGDPDDVSATMQTTIDSHPPSNDKLTGPVASYHGGLDVLHAVSAALIDGTRDILLGSDFENAMKVLTSWIPVRDEELLMRVAKAEWKMHRRKK